MTGTDAILVRSIQVLLFLAAAWFLDLMVAVNDPSIDLEDAPASSGSLRGLQTPMKPEDMVGARKGIFDLRQEFYSRYGGEKTAVKMLKKGVKTFEKKGGDTKAVRSTADRFLKAIVRNEASPEFVMAFAGYSVTVGRGNHLEQSYPFILKNVLAPILELPPFNTKLVVRNSAIGGIPSFPYGWCLSNFLGEDADLVSWDYGMNEGNGALGLESYVRQALMMPKSPPIFVMLDMKKPRLDVLQEYVNSGALPDPIALAGKEAVDKALLKLPEDKRPPGLQKWDEWGAPKGAPGQSPWHPKKMEHDLLGWMLAMHMADALDVALEVMEKDVDWRKSIVAETHQKEVILPPTITHISNNEEASFLHGTGSPGDDTKWHMNHLSCRTSFLPNISGDLNSIVESGVTKDDEDMLKTRDDSLFDGGWVMDVGKVERETKLKVMKIGGLGYIDMKTALYGIPSSGVLKLWLPYEGPGKPKNNGVARDYYNAVILCEVNEKRGDKECKMTSDLKFKLGGASVASVSQVKEVASYLSKAICVRLDIPDASKVYLKSKGGAEKSPGMSLEISVTGEVTRDDGACSISHVVWENKDV